jgi:hypothetical protein
LLKTVCLYFFTVFPEYSEKSGEFDKNRDQTRRGGGAGGEEIA